MRITVYLAPCLLLVALVASSCLTSEPRDDPYVAGIKSEEAMQRELYEANIVLQGIYSEQVKNLQERIETLQSLRRSRDRLREQLFSGQGGIETIEKLNFIDSQIKALSKGKDDDALQSELRTAEENLREINERLKNMRVPRSSPEENERGGGGEGGGGGGGGDSC